MNIAYSINQLIIVIMAILYLTNESTIYSIKGLWPIDKHWATPLKIHTPTAKYSKEAVLVASELTFIAHLIFVRNFYTLCGRLNHNVAH